MPYFDIKVGFFLHISFVVFVKSHFNLLNCISIICIRTEHMKLQAVMLKWSHAVLIKGAPFKYQILLRSDPIMTCYLTCIIHSYIFVLKNSYLFIIIFIFFRSVDPPCHLTRYGCCFDNKTIAKGPHMLGCDGMSIAILFPSSQECVYWTKSGTDKIGYDLLLVRTGLPLTRVLLALTQFWLCIQPPISDAVQFRLYKFCLWSILHLILVGNISEAALSFYL